MAQAVHADAEPVEYCPTAHALQPPCPVLPCYWPDGQPVHDDALPVAYVPAPHALQPPCPVLP